MGGSRK